MSNEEADKIATGLNNMGNHIGSGIAWLGFWLFLGLSSLEIIQQVGG